MMKKILKLFASTVGLIMVLALVPVMAGAAPAGTTPEEAFATHLQVVDAGLLSGGRDTSVLSAGVPTAADFGPELAAQAQQLAVYENSKAVGFGAWAARHGDTYKSVTSVPTTRSVSVIGTSATIVDDVVTTLLWSSTATSNVTLDPAKAADVQKAARVGRAFGPGDIITSIVSTQHTVTLALVNGSWAVVSDAYLDPFANDLAANHVTPRPVVSAGSSPSTVASPPTLSTSSLPSLKASAPLVAASYTVPYNRYLAAAYADKYTYNYNPLYASCYPEDCANFVSQALWDPNAGFIPSEMPYWGNVGGSTCLGASPIAWRYTPSQHSFFVANPNGAVYNFVSHEASGSWSATNAYNISSMLIGDVIFYDWAPSDGGIDHIAIAAAYAPDYTTLIDQHTENKYQVRYDFGSSYNNGVTYYMDHFKDSVTIP